MKKLSFFLLALCITTISCSKDESSREEEQARLDKMYQEIIDYSQVNSKSCTNPDEWAFMKYSPSNCSGYMIYNKAVDADIFRKKIDQFREAQGKFDAKWGVYYTSDCAIRPAPTGIECIDGKPTLIYSNTKSQ